MSDLISRQDAIDALCNDYCGGHQDCKYYPNCENLKSIQKLPSANQWIKCKDKLPNKFDKYLVVIGQPWLIPRFRWIDVAFFVDGHWYDIQEGCKVWEWMPLPPSYKGELRGD